MQRVRWWTIALLLLASLSAPLLGQEAVPVVSVAPGDPTTSAPRIEGPPVLPGSIASASLHVPAVAGSRARGRFHLVAYPNVRLFSDTLGAIDVAAGDTLIPVTYSVPRTQDVGMVAIARLYVEWSDGTRWEAEFQANVQARRGLRVAARPDLRAAPSPEYMVVRYLVTNIGNGIDTVGLRWDPGFGWTVRQPDKPIIIAAGQTQEGTIRVEWPHGTLGGEMHLVQVTASDRGTNTTASVPVRVPFLSSEALGLASAQSNVFVGSSTDAITGNATPAVAVNSTSQLSPDTRVSFTYRRPEGGLYSRVFASEVGAPQARFELRRPGLTAALGTVYQPVSSLLGSVAQGDGADVEFEKDALHVAMFAARPSAFALGTASDNAVHATADYRLPVGSFGLTLTNMQRVDSLVDGRSQVRAAGLTFRRSTAAQRLNVELGYMQLQDAAGANGGAAVDASYDGTLGASRLFARLHSVPAVLGSYEVLPSMASLGATVPLTDALSFDVSGVRSSVHQIGSSTIHSQGMSAGFGVSNFGMSGQLMANLRRADAPAEGLPASVGRTISTSVTLPVGIVSVDGYAELGTRTAGDSVLGTRLARGGVRWQGELGYLWGGLAYAHNEMPGSDVHFETSGMLYLGKAQLEFGASLNTAPESYFADRRATPLPLNLGGYWTRVSFNATSETRLVSGVEYDPIMARANAWRLSLGVAQALDVPLPVRRAPVVSGEVFDDVNGNGTRDENEPGVAGIVLKLGGDRRQTSQSGDFNFADWQLRGQKLEIDAASLPDGYMILPSFRLASRGHVAIPLIRAASVVLVVHEARPDGSLSDQIGAPDGLVATLSDGHGRNIDVAPQHGVVTFDAVLPGEYDLTITVPPSAGIPSGVTQKSHLTLKPGDKRRLDVGAPSGKREIRFGPASSGSSSNQ